MVKFFKPKQIKQIFFSVAFVIIIVSFAFAIDDEITVKTFDDTEINVIFKNSNLKESPLVIFVNDYNEKKEKWSPLADKLLDENFSVVEYNLRQLYPFERQDRKLQNNDYEYRPAYFLKDLDAIFVSLDIKYGIKKRNIILIGSGLGANIALKYATANQYIKFIILIAPRKEEIRVMTKESIRSYGDRPIMFLTSMNDKESYNACIDYMAYLSRNKSLEIKFYYIDRKPMDFFKEKIVIKDIMEWINKYYK